MTIKVGDKIPSVSVKHLGADGMAELNSADLFAGKKVVMFGVPAAYSPTCSEQHVPGFVASIDQIKAKGVDTVVCHSVNDPFVMKAWAADQNVDDKLVMFPDADAALAKALGTNVDLSGAGLGVRSQRYALIAEDGVVSHIGVEDSPPAHGVSSAEAILEIL
ncbi:MAG: peroxiredoxin [Alphaproteobacteria bacterium]